jgi:hypothetical protein
MGGRVCLSTGRAGTIETPGRLHEIPRIHPRRRRRAALLSACGGSGDDATSAARGPQGVSHHDGQPVRRHARDRRGGLSRGPTRDQTNGGGTGVQPTSLTACRAPAAARWLRASGTSARASRARRRTPRPCPARPTRAASAAPHVDVQRQVDNNQQLSAGDILTAPSSNAATRPRSSTTARRWSRWPRCRPRIRSPAASRSRACPASKAA